MTTLLYLRRFVIPLEDLTKRKGYQKMLKQLYDQPAVFFLPANDWCCSYRHRSRAGHWFCKQGTGNGRAHAPVLQGYHKINSVVLPYYFFKRAPIHPPNSISHAIPRCTISPPQMLPVLKLTIPNKIPPQKLLMASPIGLPK